MNDQGFQVRAILIQINNVHLRYLSQLCMTRTNLRFAVGAVQGERLCRKILHVIVGKSWTSTGKGGGISCGLLEFKVIFFSYLAAKYCSEV